MEIRTKENKIIYNWAGIQIHSKQQLEDACHLSKGTDCRYLPICNIYQHFTNNYSDTRKNVFTSQMTLNHMNCFIHKHFYGALNLKCTAFIIFMMMERL